MFRTEHLEGRLLYETDEAVCINVFISRKYTNNEDVFLTQIIFSLVNGKYISYDTSFTFPDGTQFTYEEFSEEVTEGLVKYGNMRRSLELSK